MSLAHDSRRKPRLNLVSICAPGSKDRSNQLTPLLATDSKDVPFRSHRSPVSPLFSASASRHLQFLPSVNPLFATLPRTAPVSPFLATDPKTGGGVSPSPGNPFNLHHLPRTRMRPLCHLTDSLVYSERSSERPLPLVYPGCFGEALLPHGSSSSASTSTATDRIIRSSEITNRAPFFFRARTPSIPASGPVLTRTRRPTVK